MTLKEEEPVKVQSKSLLDAVVKAGLVVDRRAHPTVPLFGHVTLGAEDGVFRVSAMNPDQQLSVLVCEEPSPWAVSIPFVSLKTVMEAEVKREPFVELECDAGNPEMPSLVINAVTRLQGRPFESGWMVPMDKVTLIGRVAGDALRRGLQAVLPAVCKDASRPNITNVCWNPEKRRLVGTDGHRLHWVPLHMAVTSEPTGDLLLPLASVKTLLRCLPKDGQMVEVSVANESLKYVLLEWAGVRYSSRMVDATYPPLARVLSEASGGQVARVERGALMGVLEGMDPSATVTLTGHPPFVDVVATNNGVAREGRLETSVGSQLPAGVGAIVRLQYLMEALKATSSRHVDIAIMAGDAAPPVRFATEDLMALIMPIRPYLPALLDPVTPDVVVETIRHLEMLLGLLESSRDVPQVETCLQELHTRYRTNLPIL